MIYLALATCVLVFLRAWQQQNVIHGYYGWAFVTSYGMSLADVLVILGAVDHGLAAVPWMGTGGAIGVIGAMLLHKRIRP